MRRIYSTQAGAGSLAAGVLSDRCQIYRRRHFAGPGSTVDHEQIPATMRRIGTPAAAGGARKGKDDDPDAGRGP
jgi:hypothetical protein